MSQNESHWFSWTWVCHNKGHIIVGSKHHLSRAVLLLYKSFKHSLFLEQEVVRHVFQLSIRREILEEYYEVMKFSLEIKSKQKKK